MCNNRLKSRREELEIDLDTLSHELDIPVSSLNNYENGNIDNVPENILEQLATELHTTTDYLLGLTDEVEDWVRIGEENAILPPNDYEGSYEDYVKFKMTYLPEDL